LKQAIFDHLKNLIGWKTNRKIVTFSIDDYGNVRLASKQAKRNIEKSGSQLFSRFDAYDTLETKKDLSALYEVLSSVKDKNGNPVVFTAFSVPVNVDFEKMEETGYKEYYYERLYDTFNKLSAVDPVAYEGTWCLWKEGMKKKLIHPEFHGREHFNLKVFKEKLGTKDKKLMLSLKNRSLTSIADSGYSTISFTAAFDFYRFEENNSFESIIKDGLDQFEKVFGFRAKHFTSPGGREHPIIHKYLNENGIQYINTPLLKKEHQGKGKYKRRFHYSGKQNKLGQNFQVRNCVFEPTLNTSMDWVDYTFKQVETALKLKRPAIISSHRVNFCGHIDPKNREKGLSALKELLKKITDKYPDVEFMTSTELGNLLKQKE